MRCLHPALWDVVLSISNAVMHPCTVTPQSSVLPVKTLRPRAKPSPAGNQDCTSFQTSAGSWLLVQRAQMLKACAMVTIASLRSGLAAVLALTLLAALLLALPCKPPLTMVATRPLLG